MEHYEHEEICEFRRYAKQTLDLMVDAYKWKIMAQYCDNMETRNKYTHVSDALMELFMTEHNNIGAMFKEH